MTQRIKTTPAATQAHPEKYQLHPSAKDDESRVPLEWTAYVPVPRIMKRLYTYVQMYVRMCVYVCMYVRMCACMHVYVFEVRVIYV